jgi:hypothetical protein
MQSRLLQLGLIAMDTVGLTVGLPVGRKMLDQNKRRRGRQAIPPRRSPVCTGRTKSPQFAMADSWGAHTQCSE